MRRVRPELGRLAFVVAVVAEIAVLILVARTIGVAETIGITLLISLLGGWLVKHAGLRAWRALSEAAVAGRPPDRELADGALVVAGGGLLLLPGFLSDVLGLFLVLPVTRPAARRLLGRLVRRRAGRGLVFGGFGAPSPGPAGPTGPAGGGDGAGGHRPPADPRVIRGEVVDEEGQQRSEPRRRGDDDTAR